MPTINYQGAISDGGGSRKIFPGVQWKYGDTINRDIFARMGKVVRVDEENGLVDLRWLDFGGMAQEVPLALPYATRQGQGHGMPSIGATAVCVFFKYSQHLGKPIVIGWLKRPWASGRTNSLDSGFGLYSLLDQSRTINQDDIAFDQRIGSGAVRNRNRKVHPGDIHWISDHGGEVYLDENIQLSTAALDELLMRADDHTVSIVTGTTRFATEAGRHRTGVAYRNDVIAWAEEEFDTDKEEFTDEKDDAAKSVRRRLTPENQILPVVTRAGKFLYIPTTDLSKATIDQGGTPWVEDMMEIREVCDWITDVAEDVHDHDLDQLYPETLVGDNHIDIFIRRLFGTYVGNDPFDKKQYGVPIYRRLFERFDGFKPDAPIRSGQQAGNGKKSRGEQYTPLNKDYLDATNGQGLNQDRCRLRIRENQEASLFHLFFAHTDQFGRTVDLRPGEVRKTTLDVTKEGVVQLVVSASSDEHVIVSTGGKEEDAEQDAWNSAGRSVEAHFDGSIKTTHGRNVAEEESVRQSCLGKQVWLWGSSQLKDGEDKNRADGLADAFHVTHRDGRNDSRPGSRDGKDKWQKWPVLPHALTVANRNRSLRWSTWGGHDWYFGRTSDNHISLVMSTAGQVKQHIGYTQSPATINPDEVEAVNGPGRVLNSVLRVTRGGIEEIIGTNEKKESWNVAFTGQIKQLIGVTPTPTKNTSVDIVGPNGPGRKNNSIVRQIAGSVEEVIGANEKEESYVVVYAGQVKQLFGNTTKPTTNSSTDIEGPNGPGRKKNSVTRQYAGSIEEIIGINDKEESYNAVMAGQLKLKVGTTTKPTSNSVADVNGPFGPGSKNNSINLEALGSLEAKIGQNDDGQSIVVVTSGSTSITISGADSGNNGLVMTIKGSVTWNVEGNWVENISGTKVVNTGQGVVHN